MQKTQHPISSTSALVLLWSGFDCYRSPAAQKYLNLLDLSQGARLCDQCNAVWSDYAEVIRNRKFAIVNLMEEAVRQNQQISQVVILAAGLAPLSLEWKSKYQHMYVYDVDIENMDIKQELISRLDNQDLNQIGFVTSNITDADQTEKMLRNAGVDFGKPVLVILEGISYYLEEKALQALFHMFSKHQKGSRFVLDYLVPAQSIRNDRRFIPEQIFDIIKQGCGLAGFFRYASHDLSRISGGRIDRVACMAEIEKLRSGKNTLFPTVDSGWIEVCLL